MRLFLVLFCCACVGGCGKKPVAPPPTDVTAFVVQPKDLPAPFSFVGVARSSHPVQIRARVEGYLLSIDYVEGSMVQAGAPLFKLDPRPFQASVEEAQGALARQEAILWRAERSVERMRPLFEKHAASERDLDNAIAQKLAAEADVLTAKANLVKAELELSYTQITAPIQGWAGRALFREGTLITPSVNGELTEVSVIDPIWVYFSISDDELLAGRAEASNKHLLLPPQKEYTVTLELADGTTFPHTGKVNFASPTLDPQTGTLTVRADFPNPEGSLLPSQFVRATVSGAIRPQALFVPQQSIFQGTKGLFVFIIQADGTVTARAVEGTEWSHTYWILTSGVQPGDRVVVEGVNKVSEGSRVRVIEG